jgi:ectoine hydroxylase-related dioxygenase (phytanoyl-CoA dioxygenase family)
MIRRVFKNLAVEEGAIPEASAALERDGYAVLRSVFDTATVHAIVDDIERVFDTFPAERSRPDRAEFRYEMLNRSAPCHAAVGTQAILSVIEPLLGDDCHVIANTAWRNPPDFGGGLWHCDAGPHVPRPEGVPWDDRIPYPVFAIGAHLFLRDCVRADGPTAVLPGSHRSGQMPPIDRLNDPDLTYEGREPVTVEAAAGDVALFVSDVWHRGLPAGGGGRGRMFLQAHYGRRDIAQRIRTTDVVNHLSPDAIARATTPRERALAGLHDPFFYDA